MKNSHQEIMSRTLNQMARRRFPKMYLNYNAHVMAWIDDRRRSFRAEHEMA